MKNNPSEHSSRMLILIGLFKLLKALLLVLIAIVAHRLVHQDILEAVSQWARHVRIDPGNHYVHVMLAKLTGLSPRRLQELSVGTLMYAALFMVEGIGLLLRKKWAEYLTVVSTAGFLPLEGYELFIRPRVAKAVLLLLNLAIVVYLIVNLRRKAQPTPITTE